MYQWLRRSSLIALFIVGQASLGARPVQAGDILNWLFGPSSTANEPVVAYYPPATTYYAGPQVAGTTAYYAPSYAAPSYAAPSQVAPSQVAPSSAMTYQGPSPTVSYRVTSSYQTPETYQGASCGCSTPTVVYQAPQNMSCPTPVTCPPPTNSGWSCLGSCFGGGTPSAVATVRPAPRSYYRTSWKRVSVTNYRPVTSADPITNCPVTVMKPCTTYAWQPERRRCGFFGRLFGQCDPGPAAAACPPDPCMMTQCVVAPSCCDAGIPSVSAPAPAGQPYYAPTPAATYPNSSVLPPTNVPSPTLAPQDMPPAGVAPPAGPSGAPLPADTRPSLVPGETPSGIGAPQPLSSSNWSSGMPGSGSLGTSVLGPEMAGPQQSLPSQTTLSKPVPLPSFGTHAAQPDGLKMNPVPDPDAVPAEADDNSTAPQLLDPRDRVASLRANQAWACTPISWPRATTATGQSTRPVQPQSELLDDGGWRSIAQ